MTKITKPQKYDSLEDMKKEALLYGVSVEKTVDTIFEGYNGHTYDAKATLEVDSDGEYRIAKYEYYIPSTEEWNDPEERDWHEKTIQETFFNNE